MDAGLSNIQPPPNPAAPGNTRRLAHGAYSERLVGPLAKEKLEAVEALCQDHPAGEPYFAAARAILARKLARLEVVSRYIEETREGSPLTHKGGELSVSKLEQRLMEGVEKSLADLGLTPSSAAKLRVDLHRGESIAEELRKAGELREARERRDKT